MIRVLLIIFTEVILDYYDSTESGAALWVGLYVPESGAWKHYVKINVMYE